MKQALGAIVFVMALGILLWYIQCYNEAYEGLTRCLIRDSIIPYM